MEDNMNKTIVHTTSVLIGILTLLAACTSLPPQETIKIGWIGGLTGSGASYGNVELNAAKMALDDLNAAGGINGKHVELLVEDGKCDGSAATTAATKLIEVDQVKYIIGGHCSTESLSIVPITERNKIFMLAGATATAKFAGSGKYAFRTTSSVVGLSDKLANIAVKNQNMSVATLHELKDWPQSSTDTFVKSFTERGGKILGQETFAPGTTDFKTQLLKINDLHPDALVISVQAPDTAALILKQMNELGLLNKIQIYGDLLFITKAAYDSSGGLLPETAIGTTHVVDQTNPATKAFLDRYHQKFGAIGVTEFFATEGYDGVRITADLIAACATDVDCARQTLLAKQWQGVTGTFTFNEQGDATPHTGVVRIVHGNAVYTTE